MRALVLRWVCLMLLLGVARAASANEHVGVIPPGQEELLADMLGRGVALPGGCRWSGASIDQTVIVAHYHCDQAPHEVTWVLMNAALARTSLARTERFLWAPGEASAAPPGLLDAVVARVRERERRWVWAERTSVDGGPSRRGFVTPHGTQVVWGLLGVIGLLFATGLACVVIAGRPTRVPFVREPLSPLTVCVGAVSMALLVMMSTRFRYIGDDYGALLDAEYRPWNLEPGLRIVSVSWLFDLGVRVGGHGVFLAANLLAIAAVVGLWVSLLRRAGFTRNEAWLSAAVWTLAPGLYDLMRWGSGFQQIAAIALILGVVRLVDAAARERTSPRRRAGLLVLSIGLTALGVFVKFPVLAVLPVMCWLWGHKVVRDAATPVRATAFHLVYVAALALPLGAALAAGVGLSETGKAGWWAVGANAQRLLAALRVPAMTVVGAVLVLSVFRAMQAKTGRAALAEVLWRALADPLEGAPLVPAMGLLAVVWGAPFLLNGIYFAPYYGLPVCLPLSAVVGRLLTRVAPSGGRAGWLAAAVATGVLVPYGQVHLHLAHGPYNDAESFLRQVAAVARGREVPARVVLEGDCADDLATRRARADLAAYLHQGEGSTGLTWSTQWPRTVETLVGDGDASHRRAGDLVVGYCPGRSLRLLASGAAP